MALITAGPAGAQCEGKRGLDRLRCQATTLSIPSNIPLPNVSNALLSPAIEHLLNEQPVTTSFRDAQSRATGLSPGTVIPERFGSMRALGRTQDGGFYLQAGAYEGSFQSYCLKAGTHGPSQGSGYLAAPLTGPKSEMVKTILKQSMRHPEVGQHDIQQLLWAIIAKADYRQMPLALRNTAAALLSPQLLEQLMGGPISRLPDALRQPLEREMAKRIALLKGPLQRVLRAESDLRSHITSSAPFSALEQAAVLTGLPPLDSSTRLVEPGTWTKHRDGYYVRYLPKSYSQTTVQLFVPESAAPGASGASQSLAFDPTEELAVPANTASQRLGITGREVDGQLPPPGTRDPCEQQITENRAGRGAPIEQVIQSALSGETPFPGESLGGRGGSGFGIAVDRVANAFSYFQRAYQRNYTDEMEQSRKGCDLRRSARIVGAYMVAIQPLGFSRDGGPRYLELLKASGLGNIYREAGEQTFNELWKRTMPERIEILERRLLPEQQELRRMEETIQEWTRMDKLRPGTMGDNLKRIIVSREYLAETVRKGEKVLSAIKAAANTVKGLVHVIGFLEAYEWSEKLTTLVALSLTSGAAYDADMLGFAQTMSDDFRQHAVMVGYPPSEAQRGAEELLSFFHKLGLENARKRG